ncbi:MAG: DUF262 domain-containing protein [Roseiflexaceae bacterium]
MNDTQSQTESLLGIVNGINNRSIMLPEFQRDFRWELERTYDLFDSLIREIFIGTIIYGKPAFGMTLREIDTRPRKGKGSSAKLTLHSLSSDEIKLRAQTQHLRIVLDGQQRLTSLYRAITGVDNVYLILKDLSDATNIGQLTLEDMLDYIAGDERAEAISVKLSDAYLAETKVWEDEDFNERFAASTYAQRQFQGTDTPEYKTAARLYRRAAKLLIDFYKQQKMLAFYLLDMDLEKFCLFFERSNSRGIQLNFTDILAAKLYSGFNLRAKIDEFENQTKLSLNREIIVRAIAYIRGAGSSSNVQIDKSWILKNLDAQDFVEHWDEVCAHYTEALSYLASQHYILSQEWMPSENMLIPLMMFVRTIGGFDRITEEQRRFIEFWYWASVFANRYSTSTNEVIITDSQALIQIAQGQPITARGYFMRMRSLVTEPDDLFSYTKRASSTYRGVLNLINYAAQGLRDWKSKQKLQLNMRLEDHHIFPTAYIGSRPTLDLDQGEAEQLADCVVNRTLIPKDLNIKIGKRAPHSYLSEIKQSHNPHLADSLKTHLIPEQLLSDPAWSNLFNRFLEERAKNIFALIERYAIAPAGEMAARYSGTSDVESDTRTTQPTLRDMLVSGQVNVGDRVYVNKHQDKAATIISGSEVDFNGQRLPINTWGQQVTGWSSINIYENVVLERTGQPLKRLRDNNHTPS